MLEIRPDIQPLFSNEKTVQDFLNIDCHVVRAVKNRETGSFTRQGKSFFIKKHFAPTWPHILSELLHFRLPQFGAASEYHAIKTFNNLNIPTMSIAAFGQDNGKRWGGGVGGSLIVTDEITPSISLEYLSVDWPSNPPPFAFKQKLLRHVADSARNMHQAGINHRDFYICHFLLEVPQNAVQHTNKHNVIDRVDPAKLSQSLMDQPRLFLIDLHRCQMRKHLPQRWQIKDLAGIYFSSMDIGLTRTDLLRFIKIYTGLPLRQALKQHAPLLQKVQRRANQTYTDQQRKLAAGRNM